MSQQYTDYHHCAKQIIAELGNEIVVGVPVAWGKPIGILNALYECALTDSSLQLTIITGLTLAKPSFKNELERRLAEPILARLLKNYEDPLYEKARELQQLPKNIKIIEFFLSPGKFVHNDYVQQHYTSCNYTDVARNSQIFSINVLAQQVAISENNPEILSLSCNTDLFHEMYHQLLSRKTTQRKVAIVAEINSNLPFMYGESAEIPKTYFSHIIDKKPHYSLFTLAREKISPQDYMIGIYASCLIKDDGCLQIGIGKLGSAVAQSLVLRHQHNNIFQDLLAELKVLQKFGTQIDLIGSTTVFKKGLYASTEMFSDEYLHLYQKGILKKKVYDHSGLQKLLNQGLIKEDISSDYLSILIEHKVIHSVLTESDFLFLKKFGVFNEEVIFEGDCLKLSTKISISTNLNIESNRLQAEKYCLGKKLKGGKLLHSGFFFGSQDLLNQLNRLSAEELNMIEMSAISRTNSLLSAPELLSMQRINARFINSALMIGLGGETISDCLKNYQEISGVGGQHDFAVMANQLNGARSVINCHSTRYHQNKVESNIIWDYPNSTLPRHLKDIFITEYGIADCRGKTDTEVIKAILNITDSRFQQELLTIAKKSGKVASNYQIPTVYQYNYPETYERILNKPQFKTYLKDYPFGSDLTAEEEFLAGRLFYLKNCSILQLINLILRSLFRPSNTDIQRYLERMQLAHPKNLKDFFYRQLVKGVIIYYQL